MVISVPIKCEKNYKRKWIKKIKRTLPPIGLRIIKSAVAIAICYLVSFIRGNDGIVFYSQLAALWCMQVYMENSKKNAAQRFIGTLIGAVYGLAYLLIEEKMSLPAGKDEIIQALMISGMIVIVLYTTVLIRKKQASYFSCVVFLSIVVNHVADSNPYLFVWNRFLDTVIGIVIGIGVNSFSLPKNKHRDILFISGLDDTLLQTKDQLSDYSRVELNRMLDEGANFTISTMRTPASLREPMQDIRLKLPVIAMDGAVIYDIRENVYMKTYIISNTMSKEILDMVHNQGLECFVNVIIDDMLVIYYRETGDPIQNSMVKALRRSPYRNYVKSEALSSEDVVYFMLLYPKKVMDDFYQVLVENGITDRLKVLKYDSPEYHGYSYIKIYNKNATRENMSAYLKDMLGLKKTITFGSIEGRYDVVVGPGDTNKVVRELKRKYETVKVPWKKE